jgi:hypothetical protein
MTPHKFLIPFGSLEINFGAFSGATTAQFTTQQSVGGFAQFHYLFSPKRTLEN